VRPKGVIPVKSGDDAPALFFLQSRAGLIVSKIIGTCRHLNFQFFYIKEYYYNFISSNSYDNNDIGSVLIDSKHLKNNNAFFVLTT
jgi:hypothetical protein